MPAFEAPGSSGFGRWRVDPATGEVYFDPGNPGGWPVGVSTDTARAVVRDATGAVGFSALSVDVTRVWSIADTNPLLWVDASDTGSIISSGGVVSQWSDRTGNGNHLEVLPTNQNGDPDTVGPTTGTRTLNGLNALDFNGLAAPNGSGLRGPLPIGNLTGLSVFAVFASDRTSLSDITGRQVFDIRNTSDGNPLIDDGARAGFAVRGRNDAGTLAASSNAPANTLSNVGLYRRVSSTLAMNLTGFSVRTATLSGSISGINRIGVGCNGLSQLSFPPFDGRIAELIVWGRALIASEADQVGAALGAKWGRAWSDVPW